MGLVPSPSNFIFNVTAGLVAMLVAAVLRRLIVWLSRSRRKRVIVRYALLLVSVATGAIPVYYISSWFLGMNLSGVQFRLAFCAWLAQLVTIYLLYYLKVEDKKQYGEPFQVEVRKKGKPNYVISVRRLYGEMVKNGELRLNWKTIYDGIDFLMKQIAEYSQEVKPDLCVGINSNGAAIAAFIWGILKKGESPKHIRTAPVFGDKKGRFYHDVQKEMWPSWPNESSWPDKANNILVIDVEVKEGTSLRNVIIFLREKYHESTGINIAVLVASQVSDDRIDHINDLVIGNKGRFKEDPEYLPDFIAFTSPKKVKFPYQIR